MPTNLLISYNRLLELLHLPDNLRYTSLRRVFNRDFDENGDSLYFRGVKIYPTPGEEDAMERLFRHLTTVIVDESTKRREFEVERSLRLHWVRQHILEAIPVDEAEVLQFWSEDPDGIRLYIYNKTERYVLVLEPLNKIQGFYLLTAFHVESRNTKKIMNKYKRRIRQDLP